MRKEWYINGISIYCIKIDYNDDDDNEDDEEEEEEEEEKDKD